MGTGARLAAFTVGLIAAFGAAFGLGRAIGPVDAADQSGEVDVPTTVHEGGHP